MQMIWLYTLVLLTAELISMPIAAPFTLFSQRANTGKDGFSQGPKSPSSTPEPKEFSSEQRPDVGGDPFQRKEFSSEQHPNTDMGGDPFQRKPKCATFGRRVRRNAIVPSGENDAIFQKFATSSENEGPPEKVIREDSDFDSESDDSEDSFNDALSDIEESTELLNSSDSEMDIDMFTFGMPLSFVPGSFFTGFVYVLGDDKLIISFNKGHIEEWFLMNSENFCTCVDDAIFCDCNHVALNIAFRRAVHRVLVHLMDDVLTSKKIKITLKVGKNFRLRFETSNKHKHHDCPCDNLLNFIDLVTCSHDALSVFK